MKVKLGLLISVFFLSMSSVVFSAELSNVEVSASETFVSRYIWRGMDIYGDNDPSLQTNIDVVLPDAIGMADIAFNVWGAFPMSGGHEDGEEFDYTVICSYDIFDGLVTVDKGFTYFDYPNTSSTADVSEPWLSLTLNEIPELPFAVSANVFAGYDFAATSGGLDEGWYYSWGLGIEIPFGVQEGQTMSVSITNWGNDGVADLESSELYATEYTLSTTYAMGSVGVTPLCTYVANYEETINDDDEIIFGLEVSYAF